MADKVLGTTKADRALKIIRNYLIPAINEAQGAITDLRARVNAIEKNMCHCGKEQDG